MIDKKQYALDKWICCKITDCHNCPTDDWESMTKCIVCNRNRQPVQKQNNYNWFKHQ